MSKNTTKEIKAVPFFARFLEQQKQTAQQDNAPFQTLKYPSDLEDW